MTRNRKPDASSADQPARLGRVRSHDLSGEIRDFLMLGAYGLVTLKTPKANRPDSVFVQDREFWHNASTLYEGSRVVLLHHSVTEWLPKSPGRAYSDRVHAAIRRELKTKRIKKIKMPSSRSFDHPEFARLNVQSGFGCVRLAAKTVNGRRVHFMGACRNEYLTAHLGIPLILDDDIYSAIIPTIKEVGTCWGRIVGTITILSPDWSELLYSDGVPRLALRVEDIEFDPRTYPNPRISVYAMFTDYKYKKHDDDLGCYLLRDLPAPCEVMKGIFEEEVLFGFPKWIREFSSSKAPRILTDFDQHVAYFGDSVEFRISDLLSGHLTAERILLLCQRYKIEITTGDLFANIYDSLIVNRSTVTLGGSIPD